MKKLVIILIVLSFLTACTTSSSPDRDVRMDRYRNYFESISDQGNFSAFSFFYDIEVIMNRLGDGTYRYDIVITNPRVAMYDINVLAVENNMLFENSLNENRMMPSIGIFEESTTGFHLVPFQVNVASGYFAGVSISGVSNEPIILLRIRVAWRDETRVHTTHEFIELIGDFYNQNNEPEDPEYPDYIENGDEETQE